MDVDFPCGSLEVLDHGNDATFVSPVVDWVLPSMSVGVVVPDRVRGLKCGGFSTGD